MATRKKKAEETYVGCTLKALPPAERYSAALAAIDENPANEPPRLAALPGVPEKDRIAALTSKYWRGGGVKLGVAFMDGGAADLKARILSHMNAWGERSNVKFSMASVGMAQVRVARQPRDGHWSYLGTDVLQIPVGLATMNLDGFHMGTPEAEYRRVVRHETGHTLGFPHEHLRKAIIDRLDRVRTINYFRNQYGWGEEDTISNVLTPLSEADIVATALTDETSIMAYQLPASITKDGRAVVGGGDINDTDFSLAAKLWPLAAPPPPSGELTLTLGGDLKAGTYTLSPR
jgi:hypothetical protein